MKLYASTERLDPKLHGQLKLDHAQGYRFAASLHLVPLAAIEFFPASLHYPIVFSGEGNQMPLALCGLKEGQNLFVEPSGDWADGRYVPAFLRRYPFILTGGEGGNELSLSIDITSPQFSEKDGEPLFLSGKPSEMVEQKAHFSAAFSRELTRTKRFMDACKKNNILVRRRVDFRREDGARAGISGFHVIDRKALRDLPDEVALEWYREGWLTLATAHLLSLQNFTRLHFRETMRSQNK